jgi:hypothetical protein
MRRFTTSIPLASRPGCEQSACGDRMAGQWAACAIARQTLFFISSLNASITHKINHPLPRIIFCFLALSCLPQPAFSRDITIQQYVHTAWGDKEGAPSGILALAQTSDGYLWIGAIDGLYRFDGVSFERYQTSVSYALLSRPNGDLWIGGNASITLLRNGREKTYFVRDGVPNGKVAGFAAGRTP